LPTRGQQIWFDARADGVARGVLPAR